MSINFEFYNKLKEENKLIDAYTVIKNYLSRDTGNVEIFKEYIDMSLMLAKLDIDFDERKQYISEANTALAFFSETADINESVLAIIRGTKSRISAMLDEILEQEHDFYIKREKVIHDDNINHLNKLVDLKKALALADTQEEFDQLLGEVENTETLIQKDFFNKEQKKTYEILTKHFTETISSKIEELNYSRLLKINKKAVSSFQDAFDSFTKNKGKYKDSESNLKALVVTKLFPYDTSKLFNESLIYYNYVYSIIFQEVNDNLKFKLTEWSIETTKIKQVNR